MKKIPLKFEYDKKALRAVWEAFLSWFIIFCAVVGMVSFVGSVLLFAMKFDPEASVTILWWHWGLATLPVFIWAYHGLQYIVIKIVKWFKQVFKITRVKKEFDTTKCRRYKKCMLYYETKRLTFSKDERETSQYTEDWGKLKDEEYCVRCGNKFGGSRYTDTSSEEGSYCHDCFNEGN